MGGRLCDRIEIEEGGARRSRVALRLPGSPFVRCGFAHTGRPPPRSQWIKLPVRRSFVPQRSHAPARSLARSVTTPDRTPPDGVRARIDPSSLVFDSPATLRTDPPPRAADLRRAFGSSSRRVDHHLLNRTTLGKSPEGVSRCEMTGFGGAQGRRTRDWHTGPNAVILVPGPKAARTLLIIWHHIRA